MLTLARARKSAGKAGEPLPTVFKSLESATVHIRRGQFTLVAAAPGIGKSTLAMVLALQATVPSLYFSADSDAWTSYIRGAAHLTGWSTLDVENALEKGLHATIDAKMDALHHVRWDFDSSPTLDDIEEELQAYAMVYGAFPELVVVDNLRNVDLEEETENIDRLSDYMHELARTTGAAVIGLHHVKGPYNDGNVVIPLSGLMGQVGKVPELILTLHRGMPNGVGQTINVSVVKNRTGKANADGSMIVPLYAELDRMLLRDN